MFITDHVVSAWYRAGSLLGGRRVRWVLAVSCLLAACCGFKHVDDGGGGDGGMAMAGDDLAGGGGGDDMGGSSGGGDLGGDGGQSMSGCSGCGCGAPVLAVAVQSVDGSQTNDGRVLQLALGPSSATPCGPTLTANHSLNKSPTAIGWVQPDGVLYGSSDAVVLLDSARDLIRWTYRPTQYGDVPMALVRLSHAGGDLVAVGYDTQGYDEINVLALVDLKAGMQQKWWDLTSSTSPIYIGSTKSMALDPRDPTRLVYIDDALMPHPVSAIAPPYDDMTQLKSVWYATDPPGNKPTALNTYAQPGGPARAVWLQGTTSTTQDDVIYEIDDDGTGPTLFGPLKCANAACAQPFKASDAAPDPTAIHRVLATCQSPTANVRRVVRLDDTTCDVVVDGTKLPPLTYPVALAVGAPH